MLINIQHIDFCIRKIRKTEDIRMQIVCILVVTIILLSLKPFIIRVKYWKSGYYRQTRNSYREVLNDKGLYGEYLTGRCLNKLKGEKKILYNIYLQKENGETTEIDMILLHESGIYVIESKNYSGTVSGEEEAWYWKQTLQNGEVYSFYNPIRQNESHIRSLNHILKTTPKEMYYSIIVFDDRTVLKKIKVEQRHVFVIKRNKLTRLLRCLSIAQKKCLNEQMNDIYETLIQFCNPSEEVKQRHRDSIHKLYK